jgi:putative ATPase
MSDMDNTLNIPLAERVRPQTLEDFFGQDILVGEGSFLRQAIKGDLVPSMILWGPPGSGKTTLATIIAQQTNAEFVQLSAVSSGKKDLMVVIKQAQKSKGIGKKTLLFIDEIHRWNKAQQDALLPYVEKGLLTLIGATTENPSFEVNSALVSRSRVFVLQKLQSADIKKILFRALQTVNNQKKSSKEKEIKIDEKALNTLSALTNGDARMALNTLEACLELAQKSKNKTIETAHIRSVLQKSHLMYDKNGEEHYNIISALHKSMRGGDADAAVYWLARMLEAGEDPLYVARRLVRFASEDVGLADNHALILANAVFDACHKLGMPECSVHLSQCVIYLAKTKKSIVAYQAYNQAKVDVYQYGNLPVPLHIRNAPSKLMKQLGYGKGYRYTPLEDSTDQVYFPEKLKGKKYF